MSNPDDASQVAKVSDSEKAEREKLTEQVHSAFSELGRAYDDVIASAEVAVDGLEFGERAKIVVDDALEQIAETFRTRALSGAESDDFVQQSEHFLSDFSGTNEELEEAKRILSEAFDQLVQLKEEAQRAA
jgi:hypothetical protein